MGGGQANKQQASQANAAANQSEQASAALSDENRREQTQNYNYLFGANGPGSGGSLDRFLDPNSLNVTQPTGAYGRAYNEATQQTAKGYSNAKGSLAQGWANRSSANSAPSGFQAAQEAELGRNEADQRGNLFTQYVGKQYQDALDNFWNSTNLASGQAASARSGALQGAANEGSTAASIYGTAGQYHASPATSIAGSAIQAGGQAGAAAITCPARGAMIRTRRGDVPAEEVQIGDELLQMDGGWGKVFSITAIFQACVRPRTARGMETCVSPTHAFAKRRGGYVEAHEAEDKPVAVRTSGKQDIVTAVEHAGERDTFHFRIGGNHTFACDGFWSLD